jgi:hypothetical protein
MQFNILSTVVHPNVDIYTRGETLIQDQHQSKTLYKDNSLVVLALVGLANDASGSSLVSSGALGAASILALCHVVNSLTQGRILRGKLFPWCSADCS